jgi:uncharacterized protein YerC
MVRYREKWEKAYGPIPKDNLGRSYDIHHIDGNRRNNSLENLQCVSLQEHYEIHKKLWEEVGRRRDIAAMKFLLYRLGEDPSSVKGYSISEETKEKIRKKLTGKRRPKEVIEKMSASLRGRKHSLEEIKKRTTGLKKAHAKKSQEQKSIINAKISKSNQGKILKSTTKELLSRINSKLTDKEVLEVDRLIQEKVTYSKISKKFGISPAQITSIKQKKTYKWLWIY